MITLFQYSPSGNCYKVRLLLHQLGIQYQSVEIDLKRRDDAVKKALAELPYRKVPAVRLDDGRMLAESNAILWHFGSASALVPKDPFLQSQLLQWLFWEQYEHEPFIAVLRAWLKYFGIPPGLEGQIEFRRERGLAALKTMNQFLEKTPFFVGGQYSLADIALFAYTHVCEEGGFPLGEFPSVKKWIDRVQTHPKFIPMK